jgi:hypothetical protein
MELTRAGRWSVGEARARRLGSYIRRALTVRKVGFSYGARKAPTARLVSARPVGLPRTTATQVSRPVSLTTYLAGADEAAAVSAAWQELRSHPALLWTPPMWRSPDGRKDMVGGHALSAIDRNLKVDLLKGPDGALRVRLLTGPLEDRWVRDGVDPLTPSATMDPRLEVVAPTFEAAVLSLRDAVVDEYGPSRSSAT